MSLVCLIQSYLEKDSSFRVVSRIMERKSEKWWNTQHKITDQKLRVSEAQSQSTRQETTAPQWSELLSTANFNWLIQLSPDIQKIPKNYRKSDKKFENPAKSYVLQMSCKHFENPTKTDKSDIVAALFCTHCIDQMHSWNTSPPLICTLPASFSPYTHCTADNFSKFLAFNRPS